MDFKARMAESLDGPQRGHVVEFLELQITQKKGKLNPAAVENTTIHPEAGLMAVVCEARQPKSVQCELEPKLQAVSSVSISRNMQFVSLTHRPGARSRYDDRGRGKVRLVLLEMVSTSLSEEARIAQAAFPAFVLGETHGRIFPWYPPLIGIPDAVLRNWRDELVQQLHVAAQAFGEMSLQSLPQSPLANEDDAPEVSFPLSVAKGRK